MIWAEGERCYIVNENLGHYYDQLLVGMLSSNVLSIHRGSLSILQGAIESISDATIYLEGEPYLFAITKCLRFYSHFNDCIITELEQFKEQRLVN